MSYHCRIHPFRHAGKSHLCLDCLQHDQDLCGVRQG